MSRGAHKKIILFSGRKHEDAAVFIRERAQNLFSCIFILISWTHNSHCTFTAATVYCKPQWIYAHRIFFINMQSDIKVVCFCIIPLQWNVWACFHSRWELPFSCLCCQPSDLFFSKVKYWTNESFDLIMLLDEKSVDHESYYNSFRECVCQIFINPLIHLVVGEKFWSQIYSTSWWS